MKSVESILGERAGDSSVVVFIGLRDRESVLKYFSKRFGERSIKALELFDFNNGEAKGWLVFTATRILFYINQNINKFKEYDLIKWNIDDFRKIEPKPINENEIEITEGKYIFFNPNTISKKRLLSDIRELNINISEKLAPETLDLSEDQKKMLLRIYIGQNINEGLIYKFKEKNYLKPNEEKMVEFLISKGLIKENYPYSSVRTIKTLITLIKGSSFGKELIEDKLKEGEKILEELKNIPKKILSFLFLNIDSLIFDLKNDEEFFFEWEDFLLANKKVSGFLIQLCRILEKNDLAVSTNNYVSSKGGRVDPEECVISLETKNYIINHLNLNPLNNLEIDELKLLYAIYRIKDEILVIEDIDKRRNHFWNLLQNLPFDESSIQELIRKFEEKGITTKYSKIVEEKFLFSIVDKKRFDNELNSLVNKFIDGISLGISLKGDLMKPKNLLEIHSELFGLIGNFETKIRKFILNEMKTIFLETGEDWEEYFKKINLFQKLETRKNQDIENGMLPEEELIYYADILDYKTIILDNWQFFAEKLIKEGITFNVLDHGLNEINRVRRKVMHLREIKKGESNTLKFFILPQLEKIFED